MNGDSVKLSEHARERCRQMGVRTGVIKRIVRDHRVSWRTEYREGCGRRVVAISSEFPDIAVVYACEVYPPVVVTVLWRTEERYDRGTYQPNMAV
jgi:cellulose synthase/poly-beta-1,6-N-acetylglucosamine synthase-like glycosyltransferase